MMKRKEEVELHHSEQAEKEADALVLFGMTGDLARKKIFPALYALVKNHCCHQGIRQDR